MRGTTGDASRPETHGFAGYSRSPPIDEAAIQKNAAEKLVVARDFFLQLEEAAGGAPQHARRRAADFERVHSVDADDTFAAWQSVTGEGQQQLLRASPSASVLTQQVPFGLHDRARTRGHAAMPMSERQLPDGFTSESHHFAASRYPDAVDLVLGRLVSLELPQIVPRLDNQIVRLGSTCLVPAVASAPGSLVLAKIRIRDVPDSDTGTHRAGNYRQ